MLFSCGETELTTEEKFTAIVNAKTPTKITTIYSYTLASGETVSSTYITEIDGENFIFEYTKQSFADLGAESDVETVHGFVYYKDGKYSTDMEVWFTEAPAVDAIDVKLDLDLTKIASYEISDDLQTLTATLTKAELKAVLGVDVSAEEVSLTVKNNGTYLTTVSVSYETASGATVQLDTSYTYNVVNLYD